MGLFSDKCTALIDPATRQALTGPALEQARLDKKWPRCDARVSKKARFCSACGWVSPGGWWKCPSCGKWVGNESNDCWNCNHPLHPAERFDLAGGVWRKTPGLFAQRFEVGDVKRLLSDGLLIQEGTAAILLDGGSEKHVLGPGRHTPDGTLRKINWFGNPPPRSVVFVDNGDVLLPIHIEDLRSAEEIPVGLYAEATLHFQPKQAADFLANLMKENRTLGYEAVSGILAAEMRYAAADLCNTSTIEDLVKDPLRRTHAEDRLRETLGPALKRFGLELVRVGAADFGGDAYEELRSRAGENEIKRRELEFAQRMRELLSGDRMHQFKDEHDLAEYVSQIAQEKQVSDRTRDHELARLAQVQRHEIDREETAFAMAREQEQAAHQIGVKLQWDAYTSEKLLKDAKLQDEIERIRITREFDEAGGAIKLREMKEAAKAKARRDLADDIKGKSATEMVALVEDSEQRAQIVQLATLTQQKEMTPEQIMASMADQSPAAAQALAQMSAAQKDETRKLLEEYKQMFGQSRERDERMLLRVTEMMAVAAKRADQPAPQQIIK